MSAISGAVARSCQNKAEIVALDEKEAGLRATLNLGHTFGHAIEAGSGYGTFLHGEAVAIGTAMAADFSRRQGWIDADLEARAVGLMDRAQLPVALPEDTVMTADMFDTYMALDKKVADGQLRLILMKGGLGEVVFTGDFDAEILPETIGRFLDLQ